MRVGKGAAAVGIALLVIVAALTWMLKQGDRPDQAMQADRTTDTPLEPDSSTMASGSRPDTSARLPLPPVDRPVAAIFDELKKRADQGDALASCRLAVELLECRQVEQLAQSGYLQNSESAENALADAGMSAHADSMAAMQMKHLESVNRCAGINESQRKLAGQLLAQAAEAGVGEAMIRYAEGQVLDTRNSAFGMFQDKAFDEWRRDAPRFLHKALQGGEPSAVLILMTAYSDDNSLIGGLIPDDPIQAHTYRLLRERLRGKSEAMKTDLPPSQVALAQADSARLHAEYFNNAILTAPDAFQSPMTPAWARPDGAAPPRPCE